MIISNRIFVAVAIFLTLLVGAAYWLKRSSDREHRRIVLEEFDRETERIDAMWRERNERLDRRIAEDAADERSEREIEEIRRLRWELRR